jgi:RNA-directed DNA polymerase
MNTEKQPMYRWKDINWRKLEREVWKLQTRIYKASSRGDVKQVRRLQKLLIKSQSARALAVRRVTQDNQGRKTAGVDGVKSLSPEQRFLLINQLNLGSKSKPTRRVWIPKAGTNEKRPLSIPTMKDRALQGLVKLALEPQWEATFESNSYGFRTGRSCHDAIGAIYQTINKKPKYVLDADISKCFDNIDHQKLLEKVNTYPSLRRQLKAWLKAGVIDSKKLFPSEKGTPQGGVCSPLLANIALHGMEELVKSLAPNLPIKGKTGIQNKRNSISLIRYADDFVILHEDLTIVQICQKEIEKWLIEMGLELKTSKTRITHTLNDTESEKAGFDFLGFHIRQYQVGKYQSGKGKGGKKLGFKTIITPSQESQKKHYREISRIIKTNEGTNQSELIKKLNPVIRGWCNYYSTVASKKVFTKMGKITYWKLLKWGVHRHRNKGKKFVVSKYFRRIGNDLWTFATREENNPLILRKHSETVIKRYAKVKGSASPFNGEMIYWSSRLGEHPEMPTRVSKLLKKQKGKCAYCKLYFKDGDSIEVDHKTPTAVGGKDSYENWQLLHRHCHDKKTANDGSYGTKSSCKSAKPKPQRST